MEIKDLTPHKIKIMNAFSDYVINGKPFDNDAIANLIIIILHITREWEEEPEVSND